MTEDVKRQINEAKKAGGKVKSAAGPKRSSSKPRAPKYEPEPDDEDEEITPLPPATPQPRYYRSSVTVDGLGSARLVGFTEQQWKDLLPTLTELGFRPY